MDIPRLSKAGCPSDQTLEPRGRGGYQRTAKRTFLLKAARYRACIRSAHVLFFFVEVTNRPVCASKERGHYLMAQPPRLAKAGNVHFEHLLCKAPPELGGVAARIKDFQNARADGREARARQGEALIREARARQGEALTKVCSKLRSHLINFREAHCLLRYRCASRMSVRSRYAGLLLMLRPVGLALRGTDRPSPLREGIPA
jgi:hypothetical protein